ncbi:MAG: universal stress protein, partial [Rhodocyclaceae bacterium]
MNPIRTVVAPTDLSALARHAVVRACLLAAELGARLSLQHVVNAGALDTLRHLLDADAAGLQDKLLAE